MKIAGRVAVVTGAGSGIGKAVAIKLAQAGAKVGLVDQKPTVVEAAREISAACPDAEVYPFQGDVINADFRTQVFRDLETFFGDPVRICVPAAGITRDARTVKFDKTEGLYKGYPEDLFREVIDINLIAPWAWMRDMSVRLANSRLAAGKSGWDGELEGETAVGVFIGSVAADGNAGQGAYPATKAGLIALAKAFTNELVLSFGLRVTTVVPGFVDTGMTDGMPPEALAGQVARTMMGRRIKAEEIADGVIFAVSNAAVGDETVRLSGGWTPGRIEPRRTTVLPTVSVQPVPAVVANAAVDR